MEINLKIQQLHDEFEKVKQEKDAAVECINKIRDARYHTRPAYVVDQILNEWIEQNRNNEDE